MPIYVTRQWRHGLPEEPVLLYEELGDQRYQSAKWRNVGMASDFDLTGSGPNRAAPRLGVEVPPLDQINADPRFTVLPLTQDQFPAVWDTAVDF